MNVVTTNRANCKDCYKCVRSCPMKAIKIVEGHAQVVDERCIQDGMCVRVCPQGAKEVRSDLGIAKALVSSGMPVMASMAPSFVSAFPGASPNQVVGALKRLGFSLVQETAIGAELVARAQHLLVDRMPGPIIASACPTVVNLIKRYYPQAIPYLSPVVSPMVAHARMARRYWGKDLRVIFIGPCIAKKDEMGWESVGGDVAAVLTFEELIEWLNEEDITLEHMESQSFDAFSNYTIEAFPGSARLFPLEGGGLKASELGTDFIESDTLIISGLDSCLEFVEGFIQDPGAQGAGVVEMLACSGGCINGAGFQWKDSIVQRRIRVLEYTRGNETLGIPESFLDEVERQIKAPKIQGWLIQEYDDERLILPEPSEAEIRRVLAATGKFTPEDELNCGACGYDSCREKAIAVCHDMAEVEMCIPYMRARAESLSALVLMHIPNGIIVTDLELKILDINPSAEQMFKWNIDKVKGKYLPRLIEDRLFAKAVEEGKPMAGKNTYDSERLVTTELVLPVLKEGLVIGIFTDITLEERQKDELARVKLETLEKAQQVIDKQMRVAQEVAGLLGETTAETKVLLTKLINLMKAEED
jgi:iron only hydrogenase large subunit-like protein